LVPQWLSAATSPLVGISPLLSEHFLSGMEFVPSHVEVLGFFFFIHVNSSSLLFLFHVPPPTSIIVSHPFANKHVVVFSNLNPTSLTNHFELYSYKKRPPQSHHNWKKRN
jgi:hypothetical protein